MRPFARGRHTQGQDRNEKCGRVRGHKRTRSRKLVDDRRLDCQRSRDWSQETLPRDQSPRRAFAFAIFWRRRREPERFTYCERWTHDVASSGWPADYQLIGRTVDDAAGEAFDKVAKMLGFG